MKVMKSSKITCSESAHPIRKPYTGSFEFESELRSEVYNALSDVAFRVFKKWEDYIDADTAEEAMDQAYDWFSTHFWEEFEEDSL